MGFTAFKQRKAHLDHQGRGNGSRDEQATYAKDDTDAEDRDRRQSHRFFPLPFPRFAEFLVYRK